MPQPVEIARLGEAARIAQELIPAHHPHLTDCPILYLITSQAMSSRGAPILGKALKLGPRERWLSAWVDRDGDEACEPEADEGYAFVVIFQAKRWGDLTAAQQRAAVDHELHHCGCEREEVDGEVRERWVLRPHDLEEFRDVVERHGFWRPELRPFAETMVQQLPLPLPLAVSDGVIDQVLHVAAAAAGSGL